MLFYDVLLQSGLVTLAVVFYLIVFRKPPQKKGHYSQKGWNFILKYLRALYEVRKWKAKYKSIEEIDDFVLKNDKLGFQGICIRAAALDGTFIFISVKKICGKTPKAEIIIHITLPDGTAYKMPIHPDTVVGAWEDSTEGSWSAAGLRIQVLEPGLRLRIFYNGPLERISDGVSLGVRMNLIWSSASAAFEHPKDWSNSLAAAAVALEPWRDGKWCNMLDNWSENSWQHWGAIQGRFQSYKDGELCNNIWLRARGVRERHWSDQVRPLTRRNLTLTVLSKDATMFQIKGISCKELTQAFSGVIRLPNSDVENVTSTDLSLLEFCENKDGIPELHSLNVSTSSKHLKVVLKIHKNGCDLLSGGLPYQQELLYRTVSANVNGEQAVGILVLGYELADVKDSSISLSEPRILKWVDEVVSFSYCARFDSDAAKNPNIVGGKGASLALLASVQHTENYKVPPGFCITTRALDKYLKVNANVRTAIKDIEDSNMNYEEKSFKELCSRASQLFLSTPLPAEIRNEILEHLQQLRQESEEYKLGSDLRFAVRSSAVGEDGEVLSAAGQNETVLGCSTDDDVINAVLKCWASMYAFNSVHYRRAGGSHVYVGGGVVVQSVVGGVGGTAGVMFTSLHTQTQGLLITANYGLAESVVSGTVEPDSFIVSRDQRNNLSILKTDIGSKTQRIITSKDGIASEDVPESERNRACLSETEILSLAKVGVRQEQLWGAPRDIEWAMRDDGIYLLQARPITSIDNWSAEDLLHEFDTPIMSDDTLSTFANTGEVMPKPISPLSIDFVVKPLDKAMSEMIECRKDVIEGVMNLSHYRVTLNLYNTIYRRVSNEIDIGVKMMDLAVYGHLVADNNLINTAKKIHPSKKTDKLILIWNMLKTLYFSKSYANHSVKLANEFTIDKINGEDPSKMLEEIETGLNYIEKASWNHSGTSSASTASQIIAMSILLEGGTDVTNQQCNDIGAMLGSGEAVSAELPIALKRLSRALHNSGRYAEFKAIPSKSGIDWLEHNLPEVYKDVEVFLKQHGFRALMEFDLSTRPWSLEPEKFIQVLQNMDSINEERVTENKTEAEIINSLVSPKKSSTRKALAWILPLCRRMVVNRECTKAHLILIIHKQRLAFLRLARLLVKKWYLPDENLIFYFNLRELRNYIRTRDPGLLKKATQRKQYYSTWEKLKFRELNVGWPEPLTPEMPKLSSTGAKVTATPVCAGDVVARACVITDLNDIDQLEKGDILVTYSTDIGWSPYFPLLSGIVTELGGLISHGAVIARECGLPCIVGAAGATQLFRTGDLLRLSGATGVLEKVAKLQNTES